MIKQERVGNIIIRNMLMDSLIIQLAINGKIVRASVNSDIEQLIKKLRKLNADTTNVETSNDIGHVLHVKYFDPTIAINFNFVRLSKNLSIDLANGHTKTLNRLISFMKSGGLFTSEMHFLLRSILLSTNDSMPNEIWSDILSALLANEGTNSSFDTIYFMLFLLAKEVDGHKQITLLRGLTSFATVKENIPLILNTYRSLSTSSSPVLRIISVDLHVRLWLAESRTYQFLHKVLIADDDNLSKINKWEMNVAKANAIKSICSHK